MCIRDSLDVIKSADWIVDLGPEGGDGGGEVIAVGRPEDLITEPASYTGHYLEPLLGPQIKLSRAKAREPIAA